MKIKKSDLLKVLTAVKPGLAKKEFIEQACHFVFTGNEVATFNDQICIIHPFKSDFKFSVKGEEFYKTVDSIDEDELEVCLDGDQVRVNAERTQAGLSTIVGEKEKIEANIDFLKKTVSAKGFWKKLPEGFVEGVFLCMFSAMKDLTQKTTCCVTVKNNIIASLDKFRASKYELSSSIEPKDKELYLLSKDCYDLVKYDVKKYGRSPGWAHFLTDDGVIFNCKTLEGSYPWKKYDRIFEPPKHKEIDLPKEMQPILQAANVFSSEVLYMTNVVHIFIDKDTITCKSEKENGWMIKELKIKNEGKIKIDFEINCVFFNQILNNSTKLYIIKDSEYPDKAAFRNDKFTHLIALVTPRKEEEEVKNVRNSKRGKDRG